MYMLLLCWNCFAYVALFSRFDFMPYITPPHSVSRGITIVFIHAGIGVHTFIPVNHCLTYTHRDEPEI